MRFFPSPIEFSGSLCAEHPGSAPVPGAGESVPLSRTCADESSFRRDTETNARDARAPQSDEARYSKRRLPHFEKPWTIYAITISTRSRRKLEPASRSLVLDALRHFHLKRYELFAVCVMPDHVHFLLQPWPKAQDANGESILWRLSDLMHSVKSFSAHEINKLCGSQGAIWEEEFFDRYIRSESDLHEKFRYILRNPWESKVVTPDEDYPWLWTQEDELYPGSAPVPGAGESVPLSRTCAEESSFRRDTETNARDARAPQTENLRRAKRTNGFDTRSS
jgi:REP element-mobilizing transposase RayT